MKMRVIEYAKENKDFIIGYLIILGIVCSVCYFIEVR